MTFGEKLKKLRIDNHLTQDELAEKIYVTRTAISKWETDKGYPSIDSIRAISKIFSVTIDELLSTDEVFTIAEQDVKRQDNLIFGFVDLCMIMNFFLPFFAHKTDGIIQSVTLLFLNSIQPYLKIAYLIIVIGLIVCGVFALATHNTQNRFAIKIENCVSMILSIVAVLLFIISSQPYAAVFVFVLTAIKAIMLIKRK